VITVRQLFEGRIRIQ